MPKDISKVKMTAVGKYVAQRDNQNAMVAKRRREAFSDAQEGEKHKVRRATLLFPGLQGHLSSHKPKFEELTDDEVKFCVEWAICVAKELAIENPPDIDERLAQLLETDYECGGGQDTDGPGPIAG